MIDDLSQDKPPRSGGGPSGGDPEPGDVVRECPPMGGVLVTHPPGNTGEPNHTPKTANRYPVDYEATRVLYRNLDGLDVSFQGAMPEGVLSRLRDTKARSAELRLPIAEPFNDGAITLTVKDHGAKGGYAFIADHGMDGATWFFADSADPNRWNIRASLKSLALVTKGYEGCKAYLLAFLTALGAVGPDHAPIPPGKLRPDPVERISRFDWCMDFTREGFLIDPEYVVAHARSGIDMWADGERTRMLKRGVALESMTIGKMPGKQVILYNKTKEIVNKPDKAHWPFVWGFWPSQGIPTVWRIELRAGKDELDRQNIRTWDDLQARGKQVLINIANATRYEEPAPTGSPPIQDVLEDELHAFTFPPGVGSKPKEIDIQAKLEAAYRQGGSALIRITALEGMDLSEVPVAADMLVERVKAMLKNDCENTMAKWEKAKAVFA